MRFLLGLIATAIVSGCATPYSTPVVNQSSSDFVGMVESLKSPSNHSHTVDVVLVHGMCTTDTTWVASTTNNLMKAFGFDITIDPKTIQPVAIIDGQTQLFQSTFHVDGGNVRVHAILWSPATTPAKSALCYDELNKSASCKDTRAYPYKRALLNSHLKDWLLDDCLPDVVFYAGDRRSALQKQIQEALLLIMGVGSTDKSPVELIRSAETEATPLFFVTASLGSKITFDSLLMLSRAKRSTKAVKQTVSRSVGVFMAANQLPILALAVDYKKQKAALAGSGHDDTNPSDSLDTLYRTHRAEHKGRLDQPFLGKSRKPDHLTVIAFSDPNDLLSYPLKGSAIDENASYQITDVIVSNDETLLGIVENPIAAHTTYLDNPQVRKFIACGYPISDSCAKGVK